MSANGNSAMDVDDVVDLSMSSPLSSPNAKSKPMGKRKAEGGDTNGETGGKKVKASGVIELNGRKLVFCQTPYKRTIPIKARMSLTMLLAEAKEAGKLLKEIPEEHWAVVVMAGHELSTATDSAFLKGIRNEIAQRQSDVAELLTNDLLEPLVQKLFTQRHYGFLPADLNAGNSKLPASLQIRCWEANDMDKYFSASDLPDLVARRTERESARNECIRIAQGLDDVEKLELVKGEKVDKKSDKKDTKSVDAGPSKGHDPSTMSRKTREGTASTVGSSRRSPSPSKGSPRKVKMTAEEEEEAEAKKAERAAKKAEREEKRKEQEEKKAAKEREEQKKAQGKAKQAQMFGSFFKTAPKPKTKITPTLLTEETPTAGPSLSKPRDKLTESDFKRAFKPPVQRANVDWAPINRWASQSKDSEPNAGDVDGWAPKDFLKDHLSRHKRTTGTPRSRIPRGLKTAPLYGTVADMWATYQEAEDPRSVLDQLRNRKRFPWKTLAFDQQTRPPYCGTFTKRSVVVGPRTPLAQDPIFDYSYDSGDDWQEEEGGEDLDDAGEAQAEPDDADSDMAEDDEFDDWLDDTEDAALQYDDGDVPMGPASPTRREVKPTKKLVPKRITKLTPTAQGPFWEDSIGDAHDIVKDYRIQLLNDAPASIDPFTYESAEPVQRFKMTFTDISVGNYNGVKCLLSAEEVAAPKVAAVKPTSTTTTAAAAPPMPLGDASSTANATTKSRPSPKVSFPTEHLPDLLRMIEGSTKIQSDLVSELRGQFEKVATKAAIEAKVREVAVREGKSKDSQWRVKAEAWTSAGLTPPPRGLQAMMAQAAAQAV